MWTRGRRIGSGASGFVSLAIPNPNTDSDCNLPSVMAVKSAEVSQSRSLRKERKLLSLFQDCPHVLCCYGNDVTHEDGLQLYNLLLEYASGGSLADQIRSSGCGLPDYKVRQCTKSILIGLNHIHKLGYVHCDIKPHNILLVRASSSLSFSTGLISRRKRVGGILKIADFGSAKKAGKKEKVKESDRGPRGTPLYISPESVSDSEYEPHSDIWALGCTVLEMITGKSAWKWDKNTEPLALLYKIGFSKKLPEIPSGLSKDAEDFVKKCLVRDPNSRWTADMLLSHHFVLSIADNVTEGIKKEANKAPTEATKARIVSSPRSVFDYPKPRLLMPNSPANRFQKLVTEKGPDWSFSDNWMVVRQADIPVCKKRKRMLEDVQEVSEWPSICRGNGSFGLQGLQRYWGIKRISLMSDLSDVIPLGF